MLVDAKLPDTFWAEAVNTACYVQNRVLVNKSYNKTPYELFNGRSPAIGFLKPFGYHVMILNTIDNLENGNHNPTASTSNPSADQIETLIVETPIPTVSLPVPTAYSTDSQKPSSDARLILKRVANQEETLSIDNILSLTNRFEDILRGTTNSDESNGEEADISNMEIAITASPTPTLRIHKDHPKSQIIGAMDTLIQTRNKSKENVWTLVDCPKGVRPIGTKWFLKNKKDERGIVIKNKARLVAQGNTQEEGIDYDEVFAHVARIKAIRLFLAYASFMGFIVYQMDVMSAFLYGTINEEVYVMQPPGFQDLEFPAKVYKVEKAIYGLHQAPRAWQREDFILVQVYVDDIIFGSSNTQLCREFKALMHEKFQMSAMGKLNFFLGLQVLQKKDGIFLSQDKYIGDILKKVRYSDVSKLYEESSSQVPKGSGNPNPTAFAFNPSADQMETLTVESPISTVSSPVPTACLYDSSEPSSEARLVLKRVANQEETPSLDNIISLTNRFDDILGVSTRSDEIIGVEADVSNMETSILASPTPTLRILKDHPKSQIIGTVDTPIQTRHNKPHDESSSKVPEGSGNLNPIVSSSYPLADPMETLTVESPIPTVSSPVLTACLNDSSEPSSETRLITKRVANQEETPFLDNILSLTNRFKDILGVTTSSDEAIGLEDDISNMETTILASPTPTLRIHKDHPKSQIIGPVDTPIQTRHQSKMVEEQSFMPTIHQKTDPALLQFCLYSCFLSQVEPKRVSDALEDPSWVKAMQEELLQFKIQKVWTL
nr:hypothetical protein [Tanacetum cinerariifolium]